MRPMLYLQKKRTWDSNTLHVLRNLAVIRRLINRARPIYRWPIRPTTWRLH